MSGTPQKTRELTGEHVLFWFLGFSPLYLRSTAYW